MNTITAVAIPAPGSIFTIHSISCERVLTLQDGQILLTEPGGKGFIHWSCVETNGWFGFRNVVTGKFLGYDGFDGSGILRCTSDKHLEWEQFCVRPCKSGGYYLLMTQWKALKYIGLNMERGEDELAKVDGGMSDAVVWEFHEVGVTPTTS